MGSFLLNDGVLIPDEGQYIELASYVASGRGAEAWSPGYGQSLYDATWAFSGPLAFLFDLFWPSRLIGQLWSISLGIVTAAVTVRLALEVLGRRWALAAGLVVALLPSQALWSSVVLRESLIWASLAVIAVAVSIGAGSTGVGLVASAAVAVAGLLVLAFAREQTLLAAAWALVPAVAITASSRRVARTLGAAAIALVVPLAVGLGPGAWDLVEKAVPDLGTTRLQLSLDAESAFTATSLYEAPGTGPTRGAGDRSAPGDGQGSPVGEGSRLVETRQGNVYVVEESLEASLEHLPRGFLATMFRPYPWETATSTGARVARLENALWYGLYALAVVGVLTGWRRRRALAYPFVVTGTILGISFLTQGNVGTAFRHRGQVGWAIGVMAAAGAAWIWAQLMQRRSSDRDVSGRRSGAAVAPGASAAD